MTSKKPFRRQQILEALASMLEANPGQRITTARLAEEVGVSEAALYRHFPSKSKIFEGLIEFIEETLFSRISLILVEESSAAQRCESILTLLLTFTERNPGITRLLTGDALAGETARLRVRVVQLFDRIETQLKQVLREAEMREGLRPELPVALDDSREMSKQPVAESSMGYALRYHTRGNEYFEAIFVHIDFSDSALHGHRVC